MSPSNKIADVRAAPLGAALHEPHKADASAAVNHLNGAEAALPALVDIKRAIPDHCFRSSLCRSLRYLCKPFLTVNQLYHEPLMAVSCSYLHS